MKTLTITTCAVALASLTLVQMSAPADARSRHHSMAKTGMARGGMNNTGGRTASPSAAGGNAGQPSRPGAQGSGGGSNSGL